MRIKNREIKKENYTSTTVIQRKHSLDFKGIYWSVFNTSTVNLTFLLNRIKFRPMKIENFNNESMAIFLKTKLPVIAL